MSEREPDIIRLDDLGAELRALATWDAPAPEPGLWRAALTMPIRAERGRPALRSVERGDGSDRASTARSRHLFARAAQLVNRRISVPTVVTALLALAVLVVVLVPALGRARSTGAHRYSEVERDAPAMAQFDNAPDFNLNQGIQQPGRGAGGGLPASPAPMGMDYTFNGKDIGGDAWRAEVTPLARSSWGIPVGGAGVGAGTVERAVARSAAVDLATPDVRTAFLRAGAVADTLAGEFVEGSQFLGDKETASATITLRVRSDRLGAALAQLRELGTVVAEQQRGDDVTDQIVDLEARLKVERRMEQEMLGLLDERVKSPLKDVLELRSQLGELRRSIEKMVATQVQVERLVSLARIVVTIHVPLKPPTAESEAEKASKDSLQTYFSESMRGAWRGSLRVLTDALAFIVEIAIGGLPWWLLLAIVGLVLRRWWLRRIDAGAM